MQGLGETYSMISVATIAKLAGVEVPEAEAWTQDPKFPHPVARVAGAYLYDRHATEKWLLEQGYRGVEQPPAP